MKKKIFALALTVSILILGIVLLASSPTPSSIKTSDKTFDLDDCFVVLVHGNPHSSAISGQLVEKLKRLGANARAVQKISELASIESSEGLIVLFDGEWLRDRTKDPELHKTLKDLVPKGVGVAAVGGPTSKLFEALCKAEVLWFTENPASWNPPLVGYKQQDVNGHMKETILVSNSDDAMDWIEALRLLMGA